MSALEWLAAALVLLNVRLVVRRSLWNYPVALAAVSLYGWVFFGARLYSDALLQGFFFAINLYGWWNWSRSRATSGEVAVGRLATPALAAWVAGCAVATGGWGWAMHRWTDAALPWWDAGVAMLSITAQLLQSRRRVENWLFWIAADAVAAPLYAARGLWVSAALYAILFVLAARGFVEWRRQAAA